MRPNSWTGAFVFPEPRVLPSGVKETTGRSFDPDHTQMYFIASNPKMVGATGYPNVLVAVNELASSKSRDDVRRLIDDGRRVMLDSGIFNLAMEHVRRHGVSHDEALGMPPEEIDGFEELWDLYGQVVTDLGEGIWGIVELDQGGVENKPRTRARIEDEFGIVPIPVYHPLLDGWDYYDDLATNYDRICFGNIVKASPALRLRLAHTAMERGRQYPYLWTHLLGLSQSAGLFGVRMRGSLDSSSWLAPVRWQTQWRSYAMGTILTNFDHDMFAHRASYFEGHGSFDSAKGQDICNMVAHGQQEVFEVVLTDTHIDYTGRTA